MQVKCTQDFNCAPEGHTVKSFKKGDIVDGKVAKIAIALGRGVEIKEEKAETKSAKPKKPRTKKVKPEITK